MNGSDLRDTLETLVAPDGLDARTRRVAEGVRARIDAASRRGAASPLAVLGRPGVAAAAVLTLVVVRLSLAEPVGAPARPGLGAALGIPAPSLQRSIPRWLQP